MERNIKKFAVIVAGGSGTRMGNDLPKQFLLLAGKPILYHTLLKFHTEDVHTQIILVLPKNQIEYWKELCKQHSISVPHAIVEGGATRFQSVKNGLNSIAETEGIVAIHDGVRPLVDVEVIKNSYEMAALQGNAVAAMPSKDSIRVFSPTESKALDRSVCYIVQTPQTFQLALIKKAFEQPELPAFTDDATVLEYMGERINIIEGRYTNIKITVPDDLEVASILMRKK